jgi:exonuclease VII small subunit
MDVGGMMEYEDRVTEIAIREQIAETREQYERACSIVKHLEKELRAREQQFVMLRANLKVRELSDTEE